MAVSKLAFYSILIHFITRKGALLIFKDTQSK